MHRSRIRMCHKISNKRPKAMNNNKFRQASQRHEPEGGGVTKVALQ